VQPPLWDFGPELDIDFTSNIKEGSLFASDLVSLTEKFQVLLGGRYIVYKARDLSATALPQDKKVFVPTGAFIYRSSKWLMAYVSYSFGFEKGDYAPYNANNANEPTAAIESEQVELGLKVDIAPLLNVGVALFEIERDASYLNTSNDFVSSGRFQHRGVELSVSSRIGDNLSAYGNVAYLDTELNGVGDPDTLGKRSEGEECGGRALCVCLGFRPVAGYFA